MSNTIMIDAPDEGSLESINVPLLLAQAWREQRSGQLQISHGKCERSLEVRRGAPVSVETGNAEDTFARSLEDAKLIDASKRLTVERTASQRGCPQASAVLALKLLDSQVLYRAMRLEARNRIAETFGWQAGFYRWSDELPVENPSAKPHDVLVLFQEQLPHRWGTERLFESIVAVQDIFGDIPPGFRKVAQKLARTGGHAARAIERLDGRAPLGQVLGACAGDPLAAATLWTVLHTGVLRLKEGGARKKTEVAALEFDVQVRIDATDAKRNLPDTEAASSRTGPSTSSAKADALREEIETLLGSLSDLDHYSALGLAEDAGPTHFKRAYFKAAKKYHPDALARLGLDELKEPAAQVFARITEAFETLSDPGKKAAHDSGGSDEPEIDTARLAQAETSYRKGEILAKMGNFDGAREYFEHAVDLWPEEPAYQAEYGWTLYKQPRCDRGRAAHHLEIALGRAPEDAVIHLRLGLVLQADGESARADELIARARAIDPSVEE
ncbi:MAG: DnaJ domain-containing protein [bacterium]|nr:hypothetical protein [Deltaproteobacteria bacterium]MCP4906367.1 DnaJ domain-containing protein [bacterium]